MSGFRARWRELKKNGWDSKRPTGISLDHTYLQPGKTKKDVRGVDFFVEEKDLMAYLDRIDLEETQRQKTQDQRDYSQAIAGQNSQDTEHYSADADDMQPGTPESNVQRPAQSLATSGPRDTLIATSPHVQDDETSDSSQPQNPSVLHTPIASTPAASLASRRNLSMAFVGADASDDDYESPASAASSNSHDRVDDGETKEETEPTTADTFGDPNIAAPGDKAGEYTSLDSDGESEGASVYDDDEDLDFTEPDPGVEDDGVASPDIHFDASLLEAMGGVDHIARGNVSTKVLADMKVNEWSEPVHQTPYPYVDEPYEMRPDGWITEDYPGLFEGVHGPTCDALSAASSAVGTFFRFVPPHLLEAIAGANNDYFTQNLDARVEAQHVKQQVRKLKRPEFQVIPPEQIKQIAEDTRHIWPRPVCFHRVADCKNYRAKQGEVRQSLEDYDEGAIPHGCFNLFMTRDRFYHISRNLHFSSNLDLRVATDRAWQFRPVIDVLQETFQSNFASPPVMAFDEAVLPSTSPFNRMRTFMKAKPH